MQQSEHAGSEPCEAAEMAARPPCAGYQATDCWYGTLPGGPYLKGKDFNITQPQVEQALQFNPKFFEVDVTLLALKGLGAL
jgi:hypothetical protein